MPAEIVLGGEQLGRESSGMSLQPRPALGQRRFQRGEGQPKIALDRPVVSNQVVRQPRNADLHKPVTPVSGSSNVRAIPGYFATNRHEIVGRDGIVTSDVVDSSVGGRRANHIDKGRHQIVHAEEIDAGSWFCTQKDGQRGVQPREDEGSLLGVERPEDTLRPDDRHGPPSPMPMGDQDVFDGCLVATVRAGGGRSRGGFRVQIRRRDLVDARSAAEYVVSDAGSMCRRQERQDMTRGVSAEIADGVERLIEQPGGMGRHVAVADNHVH